MAESERGNSWLGGQECFLNASVRVLGNDRGTNLLEAEGDPRVVRQKSEGSGL